MTQFSIHAFDAKGFALVGHGCTVTGCVAQGWLRGKIAFFWPMEGEQFVHFDLVQWIIARDWCVRQLIDMDFDPIHNGDVINTQMARNPALVDAIGLHH